RRPIFGFRTPAGSPCAPMTRTAASAPVMVTAMRCWIGRLHEWDRSWLRLRLPLLTIGLAGLLHAYMHFPHRGPIRESSRYQTLTLTVQTTGKAAGVWEALSNFQYLNVSYEDPGLYWLTSLTIAAVKIFDPAFQPSEMVMYPVQLAIFAIAILLLTWR